MKKKTYIAPAVLCLEFRSDVNLLAGSGKITEVSMEFGEDADEDDEASARGWSSCSSIWDEEE